jgi:hypothetical protein
MKKLRVNSIFTALVLLMALVSCQKEKITSMTDIPSANQANGIYILNNGAAGNNNSSLTFYNFTSKALIPDQYSVANGMQIVGNANDIAIYGSKMYIVITDSSVVDVVDPKTSKLIKQVSFASPSGPPLYMPGKQPTSIVFYEGNAFVECKDATIAEIDTVTLTITKNIDLGFSDNWPGSRIVVANDKLYIPNSGIYCNSIVVVDLTTLTEIRKIIVIPEPVGLAADAYGHIYVMSPFDDDFIYPYPVPPNYPVFNFAGGMTVIDSKTDRVISNSQKQPPINLPYVPITVQGDSVYYATDQNEIAVYNAKTQTPVSASFVTDGTAFTYPTSIAVNPATGEVFVGDYKGNGNSEAGAVYAFDKTGKLEYTLPTGTNPVRIAFINN